MGNKSYTELLVWRHSRLLVSDIYTLSKAFPKEEVFGLTSQMRRCAVSIPSTIAEGCGRQHTRDALQFFYTARGSLYELETQLFLSLDQQYLTTDTFEKTLAALTQCKKLLQGFINHHKQFLSPNPRC